MTKANTRRPVPTRGVGAEPKEQLLGFFVVECASLGQAIETAKDLCRGKQLERLHKICSMMLFSAWKLGI